MQYPIVNKYFGIHEMVFTEAEISLFNIITKNLKLYFKTIILLNGTIIL